MFSSTRKTLLDKLLALTLLMLIILAAYYFVDQVYLAGLDNIQQEISIKKRKLAKISSILEKEGEIKRLLENQKQKTTRTNLFLSSRKPSTASSELQNKLKRLIAANTNGRILTIKPYPAIDHLSFLETLIEVRMRGVRHKELKKILYGIESSYPLLKISQLDIKRSQLRYKSIIKASNRADKLEVTFIVSGYFTPMEKL